MSATPPEYGDPLWRKSSYSNAEADCVEVAEAIVIHVRDSKAGPSGGVIGFGRTAWRAFLAEACKH